MMSLWDKVSSDLSLKARIKEFRGEFAVLVLEKGGSEIMWPKEHLQPGAKEGDEVSLSVGSSKVSDEERVKIARKVLEELVN